MEDELSTYLRGIDREDPWRVDAVLKRGSLETTERVYFVGKSGAELGPFVRKRLAPGLGDVYERVLEAQRGGRRTPHLPRIVECCRQDGGLCCGHGARCRRDAGRGGGQQQRPARSRAPRLSRSLRGSDRAPRPLLAARHPPRPQAGQRHGLRWRRHSHRPWHCAIVQGGGGARHHALRHALLRAAGAVRLWADGRHERRLRPRHAALLLPHGARPRRVRPRARLCGQGRARGPARRDRTGGRFFDPSKRFPSVRAFERALLDALPDVPAESDCPPGPPTFERPGLGERLGSLLARVPEPVGAAWDVLCALFLLVLLAGCVMAIVEPTPENASWPLWYLVWSYLAFMVPEFAIVAISADGPPAAAPRRPTAPRWPAVRSEVRAGLLADAGAAPCLDYCNDGDAGGVRRAYCALKVR